MILFALNLFLVFFYLLLELRDIVATQWSIPVSATLAFLVYQVERYDSHVVRIVAVLVSVPLGVFVNYTLLDVPLVALFVSGPWLDGWTAGIFLAGLLSLRYVSLGQRTEMLPLWLTTITNSILLLSFLESV